MKLTRWIGIGTILLLSAWTVSGQAPASPLLFVRIDGPAGAVLSFPQGPAGSWPLPMKVALRVGNVYHFRLDQLPNQPDAAVFGSLDIRDGLRLGPRQTSSDYPAPLVVGRIDVERALAGTLVTKLIVLEDARRVRTRPVTAHEPAELDYLPGEDVFEEARDLGRTLVVCRLGAREPDFATLRPLPAGSVWSPHALPRPLDPWGLPLLPPYQGGEECLRDGGDQGQPAQHDDNGRLQGVEPSDTVAEYRRSSGQRGISISNEVCLCVPRFLLVRQFTPLVAVEKVDAVQAHDNIEEGVRLTAQQRLLRQRQVDEPRDLRRRQQLLANVTTRGLGTISELVPLAAVEMNHAAEGYIGLDEPLRLTEIEKAQLKRQLELAIRLSREEGLTTLGRGDRVAVIGRHENLGQVVGTMELREAVFICPPGEPEIPEQPLFVQKWASTDKAQIGDVVTFFIRYSNLGGKPISEIAVVDNLTSRLQYVPGTAQSDRDAVFVTQQNEVGSLILRWEIRDPLPAGQKGTVQFQVKIK